MKKRAKMLLVLFVLSGLALALVYCSSTGSDTTIDVLSNVPTGFVFTNADGTTITSATRGATVQFRDTSGNSLLQFATSGNVDFTNVVAARDSTSTLVHFPSAADKSGLTGNLTMFVPCAAAANQIRTCPQAATMNQVALGCTGETTLTAATATSGSYTWDNASTHTGTDDCQVSASVDNFGTGAFALTSTGPILTTNDFPTVGVCSTGTVDVTSDGFKSALASATSFIFMHQTYDGMDVSSVPFICGKQGVWDPSDPDTAFATTVTVNMTDAVSTLFGEQNTFICNNGFTFTDSNWGFHDATTFRGELIFASGNTSYRGRVRFTVTGTGAGVTLESLGFTPSDVTMTDVDGAALATVGDVRDLLAANPIDITVNAVAGGATRITTTGGFICAGTL